MKILAIVESLTGNTMSFVQYMQEEYGDNIEVKVVSPKEDLSGVLPLYEKVMIGSYTWSHGKIPKKTKNFIIENRDFLLEKDVLIFGSGWTTYENFCGAVDGMSIILDEKFEKVKFELRFDPEIEKEAILSLKRYLGDD